MTMSIALWFGDLFAGFRGRAESRAGQGARTRAEPDTTLAPDHPDAALVARVRSGERAAFDTIVGAHFAALARCAYAMLDSRDAAEDVAQEVLADVWIRRERWMPAHGIRAYLLTAARHRALNRVRRATLEQRHAPALVPDAPARDPSAAWDLDGLDTAKRLDAALGQLSEQARQAVRLRYEAECTFPEVATMLGVSLAAAQKLVQRALARLRTLLTESE